MGEEKWSLLDSVLLRQMQGVLTGRMWPETHIEASLESCSVHTCSHTSGSGNFLGSVALGVACTPQSQSGVSSPDSFPTLHPRALLLYPSPAKAVPTHPQPAEKRPTERTGSRLRQLPLI